MEEIVLRAFREIGFEVEPEETSRRDGLLKLDNRDVVLEITGAGGGVKRKKARALVDWAEDTLEEFLDGEEDYERDVDGLLIVNTKMGKDPEGREDTVPPGVVEYMERHGYRILETPQLYRAVKGYTEDELTQDDIEERLKTDDVVVEFNDIPLRDEEDRT